MHDIHKSIPWPPSDDALVSVKGLSYSYPNHRKALTGIDLDIPSGERIALVGQNGSGKTTLIKLLCGLLSPTSGEILYKGKPLPDHHFDGSRPEIGLFFQDPDDQLFGHTVVEDVAFGLRNQGLSRENARHEALHALEQVGLEKLAYKEPHNLSYGQKKRAALAGVLAMQPDVLLLDEPTANLDPRQEEIFLDLLKGFHGTLICISHDLFFLYELCERAVVLDQGHIHHNYTMRDLVSQRRSLREHGLDFSFRLVVEPPAHLPDSSLPEDALVQTPSIPDKAVAEKLVVMRNYQYCYPDGTFALQGVHLSIHAGERISIVGENGAGKTTLLSCLIGLRRGEGDYVFDGKPVTKSSRKDLWRHAGMVFQDCADQLFCSSVREEIAFGLRRLGYPRAECRPRIHQALSMVRLEGFEDRVPLHLSGGERKRLALACVLAMEPRLLILDEPTAGLDPHGEEMFLEILGNLRTTILLVSHDMFLVKELTQRTLVIHDGRIVTDLPTHVFMKDESLSSLNGLAFSYRQRSSSAIRILQHEHEHSHLHEHLHAHRHRHGELEHEHLHEHAHEHTHRFVHRHTGDQQQHDHIPSRYHDHDHPEHGSESHDHSHPGIMPNGREPRD
ncbi:MAG: energy-coupling factor transporter ATPase [Pseudomonadota bacterium]